MIAGELDSNGLSERTCYAAPYGTVQGVVPYITHSDWRGRVKH